MKKEYIPLLLLAGVFFLGFGYYLGCLDKQNDCIICNHSFSEDEVYLWDTRTGAIFALSSYTEGEKSHWLDPVNYLPQSALGDGTGTAYFPDFAPEMPVYCSLHAPSPDGGRFMVLRCRGQVLSYFALQDGVFFNGYLLSLYFDDDSWAVDISI